METVHYLLKKLAADRTAALGALLIMTLIVVAIAAPVLSTHPEDIAEFHPADRLQGPSALHYFGTDRMGSDVYSRLLYGARITIAIAVIAIGVSVLVGVPIGLAAGYYRNWIGYRMR
jgi:peptide/nickel transport system permease protein